MAFAGAVDGASPEPTFDLRAAERSESLRQVRVAVEAQGQLRLNPDGISVTETPVRVRADLAYDERWLECDRVSGLGRSCRHYQRAQAAIEVGETRWVHELDDDRRLIVAEIEPPRVELFSPLGPLAREQLELIDVPGNSLVLERLLPDRHVTRDESWTVDDATLAALLRIDAVREADVTGVVERVEDGLAVIALSGHVQGSVGGVRTDVQLTAKLNYHLEQRLVSWLAMAVREERAIGHAVPGYVVESRIRVATAPLEHSPQLDDEPLADLPLTERETYALLAIEAAGQFQLLHDRRWQVMIDRPDVTILRLVDAGDLIAQCNVSRLEPLAEGRQLTLEGFQQDVQAALGRNFEQFLQAGQDVSESGLRLLRVAVAGRSSELPIQWIYYHLSDDSGRRASLVFTLEQSLAERFGAVDRMLVSSFQFADQPQAATSTAAAEPGDGRR